MLKKQQMNHTRLLIMNLKLPKNQANLFLYCYLELIAVILEGQGRTDTMIVATVNPNKETTTLV
ncbi:hypothetical protein, partial [Enterococcus durans]|uniref:hypothetical protein n=1 Tax=Enterococcus durans TaxID=53345 RepID=UPI001C6142F1